MPTIWQSIDLRRYEKGKQMTYDLAAEYRLHSTGDPWGDCVCFHFAIAETLYWHHGEECPVEWAYRPGLSYANEGMEWLEDVHPVDLIEFGNKLNRLAAILKARGLDY